MQYLQTVQITFLITYLITFSDNPAVIFNIICYLCLSFLVKNLKRCTLCNYCDRAFDLGQRAHHSKTDAIARPFCYASCSTYCSSNAFVLSNHPFLKNRQASLSFESTSAVSESLTACPLQPPAHLFRNPQLSQPGFFLK